MGCSESVNVARQPAAGSWWRAGEDLEEQRLVELGPFPPGDDGEQLGGQGGEDAIVAGGVVAEGVLQGLAHEGGVAGAGAQVLQAGEQLLAARMLGGQAGADARAQRQQFLAAQVIGEAGIPGEDDAQQGLGVEAGAGEQVTF